MDGGFWAVVALIVGCCALIIFGANYLEARYRRMHPPDDWDGMREDKTDEDI